MSAKGTVFLILAAVVALALWHGWRYAESVGYERASLEMAARDNVQLLAANAKIQELEKERERKETEHAMAIVAIDTDGEAKLKEVTRAKDQFVSDVVAGRIRLHDPGNKGCPAGGGDSDRTALAGPGVDHGAGGGELSAEAGRFLLEEAARADAVVVKLTACQRVLAADRALQSSAAPP